MSLTIFVYGPHPRLESGMGKVGAELATGLAGEGHDVHYYAPSAVGPPQEYDGVTLYGSPGGAGGPGIGMCMHYLQQVGPDVFVTNRNWQGLQWVADRLNSVFRSTGNEIPILFYGPPVETERMPPRFGERLLDEHLNSVWCVPFTENRYESMQEWGLDQYLLPEDHPGAWVPHGVDHDTFNPDATAVGDAPGLREGLNLGDRFLASIVAENWRRKNIDVLFDAWAQFRDHVVAEGDERPLLAMQTDPTPSRSDDDFYAGWNLFHTGLSYDLEMAGSTAAIAAGEADVFTNKDFAGDFAPRAAVAGIVAASDVYVLPTSGEAFSCTSLEAMACGTPLIQTDLPTLRWLCGDASAYVDTIQDHAINTGERMPTPSVDSLVETLRWFYHDTVRQRHMAEEGLERAQDFSWARMVEGLDAAVETVAESGEF